MITFETFQAIVSALRCAPTPPVIGPNGRNTQRMACATEATIILPGTRDQKPYGVAVLDFSFGGALIRFGEPLRAGSMLIFVSTDPDTRERHAILCSVIHSRRVGDTASANIYMIGINFVRELEMPAREELPAPASDSQQPPQSEAPANPDDLFGNATFEAPK